LQEELLKVVKKKIRIRTELIYFMGYNKYVFIINFGGTMKIFKLLIALTFLFNIDSLFAQTPQPDGDLGKVVAGMIWTVFFKFILPAGILLIIFSLIFLFIKKKLRER